LWRIENSHRPTTNTTLLQKVDCLWLRSQTPGMKCAKMGRFVSSGNVDCTVGWWDVRRKGRKKLISGQLQRWSVMCAFLIQWSSQYSDTTKHQSKPNAHSIHLGESSIVIIL
jgi:hypothetical protein